MNLSELKAGDWFRWSDQTWMLLDQLRSSTLDCVIVNGTSRGMIVAIGPDVEVKRIDVAKQLGQIRDLRLGFAQCHMDHRHFLADVRKAQDSLTSVIEVLT